MTTIIIEGVKLDPEQIKALRLAVTALLLQLQDKRFCEAFGEINAERCNRHLTSISELL